ncbi:1-deoxy-D-xylulose-5-phosphate synthase [bacterium]|nr:1-deoxy-D-xylulose-5-phosphate synthase [bacterium]MCB2202148.1 1-deoxy-D-xylulose-5-phosphate synthase [bacterium]
MQHLSSINSPADTKKLSVEELVELATECRQQIVSAVSRTGGHLASNLGAVELTLALHYIFDIPKDRIIWDVSHQTYTHKLLTGRRDRIDTIRQYRGLAGYSKRTESEYDHFGAGHASTSISAALGFAAARDHAEQDHRVIAVIGDGSMTGGLAFEAMNNAGSLKKNLLVILNDNTWSISKNVGSISRYLTNIMTDEKVRKLREEVWELTGKFKRRDKIRSTIARLEQSVKTLLVPGMLFENLGFKYFGPIDGHDLPMLVRTLGDLKDVRGPILLHVATVKGKGYAPAEGDAFKYHGVGKFDKVTGEAPKGGSDLPSYTQVYGDIICELADKDKRVVAITAAMTSGTGLEGYAEKHPDRFYDVGIAEAHAACFAAGLAAEGMRPYLTVYSTFMQRAYDQVIHDMAIQNLPVVICMDRGGLVGNDGPTHHGVFDLSYMAPVPNLTLCAPADGNEFRAMMHHALTLDEGITAIRYPRDNVPVPMTEEIPEIEWGTWQPMTDLNDVVVLAVGAMVPNAMKAAEKLAADGVEVSVVNARFVKPLDEELLSHIADSSKVIVTVEENQRRGGFGQSVADYLLSNGYKGKFLALAINDEFTVHGTRAELLRDVGLDVNGIAGSISEFLSRSHKVGGLLHRLSFRRNGVNRKKELSDVRPTGTDSK